MMRYGLVFLCVTVVMALVACGGGGSGEGIVSPDSGEGTSSDGAVRLTGVATKGTLKNAEVTVYELDEWAVRTGTVVGTVETNDLGAYELAVDRRFRGSPVEVEVAAISDRTVMTCDARRCDGAARFEDVTLTSDLVFSTITKIPLEAAELNASVTVWSAMAAKRAKALKNADAGLSLGLAIRQANSEVSQIVGFNIAQTRSKGLESITGTDEAEAQYAIMNAAAAEVLFRYSGIEGLNDVLADFTNALAGDGVVGGEGDLFTLAELSVAIRRVANSVPELASTVGDALANQTAQFDLAGDRGFRPGYDDNLSVGVDASQEEKIAAFQAFMSQVRTWLSALEDLDSPQLSDIAPVDINTVEAILNRDTQRRFQYLSEVLDQSIAFVVSNPHRVRLRILENEPETIAILDEHGDPMGSATLNFFDSGMPEGLQMRSTGIIMDRGIHAALPFELALTTGVPAEALTSTIVDRDIAARNMAQLLVSSNLSLSGFIEDGYGNRALILDDVSLVSELDPVRLADVSSGADVTNLFKSTSLLGKIRIINDGAQFTGEIEQNIVRLGAGSAGSTGSGTGPMFSEMLRLYGNFTSGDHSFSTSVTVRAKSASAYDTFSWTEYGNGSRYVSGTLDDIDGLFALAEGDLDDTVLPSFTLRADFDPQTQEPGRIRFLGYATADLPLLEEYLRCLNDERKQQEDAEDEEQLDIEDLVRLERMCANSSLTLVQSEKLLSSSTLSALEKEVRQDLLNRFGEIVESDHQLILGDFYAYADATGTVNSYTVAMRFRDPAVTKGFRDLSLTVASRIDVPELRSAQASATVRSTSHSGGQLRTDVKWNGGSYTANLEIDDIENPKSLSVRLSNTLGYELIFNVQKIQGQLSLSGYAWMNGEMIGRIELRDEDIPLIIYPNGNKDKIETIF